MIRPEDTDLLFLLSTSFHPNYHFHPRGHWSIIPTDLLFRPEVTFHPTLCCFTRDYKPTILTRGHWPFYPPVTLSFQTNLLSVHLSYPFHPTASFHPTLCQIIEITNHQFHPEDTDFLSTKSIVSDCCYTLSDPLLSSGIRCFQPKFYGQGVSNRNGCWLDLMLLGKRRINLLSRTRGLVDRDWMFWKKLLL